jgi:hypothetical protein
VQQLQLHGRSVAEIVERAVDLSCCSESSWAMSSLQDVRPPSITEHTVKEVLDVPIGGCSIVVSMTKRKSSFRRRMHTTVDASVKYSWKAVGKPISSSDRRR